MRRSFSKVLTYKRNKQLLESAEFQKFLDSHIDAMDRYDKMRQQRRMPNLQDRITDPVVTPPISFDDFGGRQELERLKRSTQPEADLRKLISRQERDGNLESASRLIDLSTEFSLQRGEISQGLRKDFENISVSAKRFDPQSRDKQIRDNKNYLTPLQTAEVQAQNAADAPDRNVTLRKNKDGSVSTQVSGPVDTSAGSAYANIKQSARDRINQLTKSDPQDPLINQIQQKLDQIKAVGAERGSTQQERDMKRAPIESQLRTLLQRPSQQASQSQSQPQSQQQDPVTDSLRQSFGALGVGIPDANTPVAPEQERTQQLKKDPESLGVKTEPETKEVTDAQKLKANRQALRNSITSKVKNKRKVDDVIAVFEKRYGDNFVKLPAEDFAKITPEKIREFEDKVLPGMAALKRATKVGAKGSPYDAFEIFAADSDKKDMENLVGKIATGQDIEYNLKGYTDRVKKKNKKSTSKKPNNKSGKTTSSGSRGKVKTAQEKEDGRRRGPNPFSKRATKDPTLTTQMEMASKRITGVKRKMRELIEQLKKEKNPAIKERLIKQLESLDRMLGSAYVSLERIKGISGQTTELNTQNFEQLRDLFRQTEDLSVKASNETGKQPAVFQAANAFKAKNGFTSLETMFKDSNDKNKSRFGKGKSDPERKKYEDRPTAQEVINLDWDEAEKELQRFDADQDDFETDVTLGLNSDKADSMTSNVLDIIQYASPEEEAELQKAQELKKKDKEEFDKFYRDPYEGETDTQKRSREKAEKKITQQAKQVEKLFDPYFKQIIDYKYKEAKTKDQKKAADQAFSRVFGLYLGMTDKLQQQVEGKGLFRKPQIRSYYKPETMKTIDATLNKLPIANDRRASEEITKGLKETMGKSFDEQSELLAKHIVEKNAFTSDGELTEYGKDLIQAIKDYDSDTKYKRQSARYLFRNLAYGANILKRQVYLQPGSTDTFGIEISDLENNGIKITNLPWQLRERTRDSFQGKVDSTKFGYNPSDDSSDFTFTPGDQNQTMKSMMTNLLKRDDFDPKKELDNALSSIKETEKERKEKLERIGSSTELPPKKGDEVRGLSRSMQDMLNKALGQELIQPITTPRAKNKIRPVKGSQADVRQRIKRKALDKKVNENLLWEESHQWNRDLVNKGLYGVAIDALAVLDATILSEASLWAQKTMEASRMYERLHSDKTILESADIDGTRMIQSLSAKLLGEIETFLTDSGIREWTKYEEYQKSIDPRDARLLRLAEKRYAELNPYHSIDQKSRVAMTCLHNPQFDIYEAISPITHTLRKTEDLYDSRDFLEALIDVSESMVTIHSSPNAPTDKEYAKTAQRTRRSATAKSMTRVSRSNKVQTQQAKQMTNRGTTINPERQRRGTSVGESFQSNRKLLNLSNHKRRTPR